MTGVIHELKKLFVRSPGWWKVRKARIKGDGSKCQACGRTRNLQVHHVLPVHLFPWLELAITNLITLCGPCHLLFGHLNHWKAYNPNVRALARHIRAMILNRWDKLKTMESEADQEKQWQK